MNHSASQASAVKSAKKFPPRHGNKSARHIDQFLKYLNQQKRRNHFLGDFLGAGKLGRTDSYLWVSPTRKLFPSFPLVCQKPGPSYDKHGMKIGEAAGKYCWLLLPLSERGGNVKCRSPPRRLPSPYDFLSVAYYKKFFHFKIFMNSA